jgi:hypothetical protein
MTDAAGARCGFQSGDRRGVQLTALIWRVLCDARECARRQPAIRSSCLGANCLDGLSTKWRRFNCGDATADCSGGMSREPRSKLVAAVIGGLIGLWLCVAHVALLGAALGIGDLLVVLVVLAFVVQPLATLGHELGHAVVALLLGARPSLIVVGRGPFLRVRAEPTLILFSVLPTRGVPFAGVCRYTPSGLPWRSIALIALAGPLATLLELVSVVLFGSAAWDDGALARALIVWTSLWLAVSVVVNLWPRGDVVHPGSDQGFRRDGDLARYAYARHRSAITAI